MENKMFCWQCQETSGNKGCTISGVCGKTAKVSWLQDLLVYVTKGLCEVTVRIREEGKEISEEVNHMVSLNMFTTITNANFHDEVIKDKIEKTIELKSQLLDILENKEKLSKAALISIKRNEYDLKNKEIGILATKDEDIRSLRELITYGIKGLAAYLKHANVLEKDNEEIDKFMQKL